MSTNTVVQNIPGQRFCQCLLETLHEAVFCVDPEQKITYWNRAAEDLTGYSGEQMIGHSCCEGMLLHADEELGFPAVGSFPTVETLEDGVPRQGKAYLRHRDGHLIPVRMRVAPVLDENGRIIGAVEVLSEAMAQVETKVQLGDDVALVDPVTRVGNHEYLEMALQARFDEMRRYGWEFGVIVASVDDADEIREAYGAEVTEQLLRMVGATFAHGLRSFDVVGRWGLQEFLAIVPIINYSDLYVIGERVRGVIERASLVTEARAFGATISVGAAGAHRDDTPNKLVKRAHLWTHQSQKAGGNTVTL
jgi:diguanylate cyclase (GGDEF)-like protein/PAS domain S-box-containing protein